MGGKHTSKLKSGTESHIRRYRPLKQSQKQCESCSHSHSKDHQLPNLSKFQFKSDDQRSIISKLIILNIQISLYLKSQFFHIKITYPSNQSKYYYKQIQFTLLIYHPINFIMKLYLYIILMVYKYGPVIFHIDRDSGVT